MAQGRWSNNVYIVGNSVVGTVGETASKQWEAYGCMGDWQDTDLGVHENRERAKQAVIDWVEENS